MLPNSFFNSEILTEHIKTLVGDGSCQFVGTLSIEEGHLLIDEHNRLSVGISRHDALNSAIS
jgi:hypothetical protein